MPPPLTTSAAPKPREHVVVLHGWGLSGYATHFWCSHLRRHGWLAAPFSYWSIKRTLDDNAQRLAAHIYSLPSFETAHLVGHSMGGIVILHCLSQYVFPNLGRVVTAGTPFQGSSPAQKLKTTRWGRALLGKAIVQWQGVHANQLPPNLELGTIAGTTPLGMGQLVCRLKKPHDGTVTLEETFVPFAKERLVLPITHSEMLVSAKVTRQIHHFLRDGSFAHP